MSYAGGKYGMEITWIMIDESIVMFYNSELFIR
jgi:hypothetical protein